MTFLYVVATPIGNLEDLTFRALRILREVDFILCEDTRETQKLLNHYGIKAKTISYHQHSGAAKTDMILGLLKQGKTLAMVSDAGTPGISDPGNKLLAEIVGSGIQAQIIPVPGASAITCAASISGFKTDKFLFLGFPPSKKRRTKFFQEIANCEHTVIFYESAFKILRTLSELESCLNDLRNEKPKVAVCREMTKKFESFYRGAIREILQRLKSDVLKGEFVILVEGKNKGRQ